MQHGIVFFFLFCFVFVLPVKKEEGDAEAEPDADEGQLLHRVRQQVVNDFDSCLEM